MSRVGRVMKVQAYPHTSQIGGEWRFGWKDIGLALTHVEFGVKRRRIYKFWNSRIDVKMAQCIMQGLFQQSWGLVSNMEGNEGFDQRECENGEVNEAVILMSSYKSFSKSMYSKKNIKTKGNSI